MAGRVVAQEAVTVKDLTVSPPVGAPFTGVMFGVFASGAGEPVLDPADFTDIAIAEVRG